MGTGAQNAHVHGVRAMQDVTVHQVGGRLRSVRDALRTLDDTTVGDKVAGQVDQVLTVLQTQNEKIEEVERQLAVTRIVAIATLVALIAFGLATAFNVI